MNKGEIRVVGVCEALNRGENLVGVNNIIKETYVGSEVDFQQQHGRGVRLKPDQVLNFYILVPMYKSVTKIIKDGRTRYSIEIAPTQAQNWADKMSQSFDLSSTSELDFTNIKL